MTRERRGDWMETFTGRQYWPLDPRPGDVCVEDIAHHLSLICRYNGASLHHYSVAEHSAVLAGYALKKHGAHAAIALLLHDAHEAYIGDTIRPLKRFMSFRVGGAVLTYDDVAELNDLAIYAALGVPQAIRHEHAPWVKEMDSRVCCDERLAVMSRTDNPWWSDRLEPLGVTVRMTRAERAEAAFLAQWRELSELLV